jgi:calnexin
VTEKKTGEFKDDTPYVIMFGPDKCGATDKVHFILQHVSPKTGKREEKHLKDPPGVPNDMLTHLYGLIIYPDNSFEVHVDGEKKSSGNLLTSMDPPINPPKDIDDPDDPKPEDWVDESKMDDPEASKPDDWDEDAPAQNRRSQGFHAFRLGRRCTEQDS